MTSKLTFRARTLDASKPMAIYNAEDLPELTELNAINRSVPAMPTGMEKEEESEKHLQDILSVFQELQNHGMDKKINLAELYIPTPEVFAIDDLVHYTKLYKGEYKVPRQYIHVQPFSVDSETPDYDLDSDDEAFLENTLRKQKGFEVDVTAFEDMIDKLEKNSGHSVVSDKEAKLLLKGNDELILAVYDYWIDKRLRLKQSLIPTVKSDKRDLGILAATGSGSSSAANTNPYIAFRRRTEKMQTRKNRKNDEASYEKMLKLRRDLSRAIILLDMIRRREKIKKENLTLTSEIFEKRYVSGDFEGRVLAEVQAQKPVRLALQPNQFYANRYAESWLTKHHHVSSAASSGHASSHAGNEKKRKEKKRKHHHHHSRNAGSASNITLNSGILTQRSYFPIGNGPEFGTNYHSEEDRISAESSPSDVDDDEMEGPFVFRRQPNVQYLAPVTSLPFGATFSDEDETMECGGGWPWDPPSEGGGGEPRYRYSLASLSTPKSRCIGFARRRVGRGGRFVLDRAYTDHDDLWRSLDFTIMDSNKSGRISEIKNGGCDDDAETADDVTMDEVKLDLESWPRYRPVTPPLCKDDWEPDPYKFVLTSDVSGLNLPTHPIKPLTNVLAASTPGLFRSNSQLQTPTRALGLRTVSVDSLGAQNAATALVTSDMIDMFRAAK